MYHLIRTLKFISLFLVLIFGCLFPQNSLQVLILLCSSLRDSTVAGRAATFALLHNFTFHDLDDFRAASSPLSDSFHSCPIRVSKTIFHLRKFNAIAPVVWKSGSWVMGVGSGEWGMGSR